MLAKPVHLSSKQIGDFRQILTGNNRPTQPLNSRVVKDLMAEKVEK